MVNISSFIVLGQLYQYRKRTELYSLQHVFADFFSLISTLDFSIMLPVVQSTSPG